MVKNKIGSLWFDVEERQPQRWSEMIYSEWSRKFIEQEIYGSYKFLCVFNVDRIVKKKKNLKNIWNARNITDVCLSVVSKYEKERNIIFEKKNYFTIILFRIINFLKSSCNAIIAYKSSVAHNVYIIII